MIVSTKGRYALRVMLCFAQRGSDEYVPLKEIAESEGISQKYLESRGWRIKRIWSMDWWRDPEHEINSICALVDAI